MTKTGRRLCTENVSETGRGSGYTYPSKGRSMYSLLAKTQKRAEVEAFHLVN